MKNPKGHLLALPAGGEIATSGPSWGWEHWLARQLLAMLAHPPIGLRLWDGTRVQSADTPPIAEAVVQSRAALYRLFVNPDLCFGDEFAAGRIEVEGDLVRFLEEVNRGMTSAGPVLSTAARLLRPRRNEPAHSRHNVHHHYDLGNDFYRLWLDEEMLYTCAYFPDEAISLEAAQRAKMDHICRKLRIRPGERVVEAGCGWGALARHMAIHYGAQVRAFNISEQQVAFARERAEREGYADRVEYVLDDYRNMRGPMDVFVSVGMLEHVGTRHYREFGATIARCLAAHGRGLIHTIGRNAPAPMNAWIERRIFPGAYPPSLCEMMDIFEPHAFSILDVENLRLHYAATLRHWLERFDAHAEPIEQMYDGRFVRAWRLYLAGSLAAFTTGWLQLFQVLFARAANNNLPPSRAHLYQ